MVRTNNNPLTYILTSAKLEATGHRWLAALSTYQFSLKYCGGKKNIYADFLSRRLLCGSVEESDWHELSVPAVRTLCQFVETKGKVKCGNVFVENQKQSALLPKEKMCCVNILP